MPVVGLRVPWSITPDPEHDSHLTIMQAFARVFAVAREWHRRGGMPIGLPSAFRTLGRPPGFTAGALIALALGICANVPARLAAGITIDQARADLDAIAARRETRFPADNTR
jgi:hypothetical protein